MLLWNDFARAEYRRLLGTQRFAARDFMHAVSDDHQLQTVFKRLFRDCLRQKDQAVQTRLLRLFKTLGRIQTPADDVHE